MTVETATYVGDLNTTLPLSTGPRAEGDDHLRLIKTVLKNSFPDTVDLRDMSGLGASDEGKIVLINSSGRPAAVSAGRTQAQDNSLTVGTTEIVFSGDTENSDDLGLYDQGAQPTRFTQPAAPMDLFFHLEAAYSGHLAGIDAMQVRSKLNGTASLTLSTLITDLTGNINTIIIPWFGGVATDFTEFDFKFVAIESADTSITLTNIKITAWRIF